MRSKAVWYSVHIYPKTKAGFFTVVVMKNFGYRMPCSKHTDKPACRVCDNLFQTSMEHVRYDHEYKGGVHDTISLAQYALMALFRGYHSRKDVPPPDPDE